MFLLYHLFAWVLKAFCIDLSASSVVSLKLENVINNAHEAGLTYSVSDNLVEIWLQAKGEIRNAEFQSLQSLTRPGSGSASLHKSKVGVVVGTLVGLASVLALIVGGTYYYLRKKNSSITRTDSMARIWER